MQKVLSKNLWTEIRKRARASKSRKGAIAYVTRDLVGFRKGDTLIVDGSPLAIKNGETHAPLLRGLDKKGVRLFCCADLHAKILLLDDVAVISSSNMSSSSEIRMVEAALISDQGSVVAGVASLIEQLVEQSSQLDRKQIAQLCKIKVVRRGGRNSVRPKKRKTRIDKLGNRTWIVGVREFKHDPTPEEQRLVDRATGALQQRLDIADDDLGWIKWGVRGRFPRECQPGDLLIQIWRSSSAKRPNAVLKAVPVLLKQRTKRWTRFYVSEPTGRSPEIAWGQFQRLLREVGYPKPVKASSVQVLALDVAEQIERIWNAAAKY